MKKYYKIREVFIPATPGYAFATVRNNIFTEHRADENIYGIILEPAHTLETWKSFEEQKPKAPEVESSTISDNTEPDSYFYPCGSGCTYGNLGDWCGSCQTECR